MILAIDIGNTNVGIGIFINASFANHSCSPNAHYVFEKGPTFILIALDNICKDEEICISYTSLYQSTTKRQIELEEIYHFKCKCKRCLPSQQEQIRHKQHFDDTIDETIAIPAEGPSLGVAPSGT